MDLEKVQDDQNYLTKDEIYKHLNLGKSDSGLGIGRHG